MRGDTTFYSGPAERTEEIIDIDLLKEDLLNGKKET